MSLNVGILSSSSRVSSTRRLREVLQDRGHKVRVLSPKDLNIFVQDNEPVLLYKGKPLKRPEAVIPRIGSSKTFFGAALISHFEQMGVFSLNSAAAIRASRNKLHAIQLLSRHGLGLPETTFISAQGDVVSSLDLVGGVPVIVKLLEGTQGIGVMIAETVESANSLLETLRKTGQDVLLQRFVAESRGRDVRALVVGGKVIGAVRRVAQGTEFRSNVHRGSKAEAIEIDPEYERTAIKAAQILGLAVAGVDMLEGSERPLVVEVNSSPSLAGMEEATGTDLTTPVVELLEANVHLRPFDVTQRLTLRQGYGVSEIPTSKGSPLHGKSLQRIGFDQLGLRVLCVERGAEVITDLDDALTLEVGDRVIVFGLLSAVRDLLPNRGPDRRPQIDPSPRPT